MSAARRAAVEALIHQEKAGYSNLVLDGRLRRSGLTGRDKAFCTAIFYTVLEHRITLDWQLRQWLNRPVTRLDPPVGAAARTSPTNIGLALLSVLAAVDLELLPRRRAAALLGHMMDTLEALPKWNGHLYNWYDTAAAQPLRPRYVSTVDSGNLCACLIALREGLYEWGEGELARRALGRSDDMGVAPLYDRGRRVVYIG